MYVSHLPCSLPVLAQFSFENLHKSETDIDVAIDQFPDFIRWSFVDIFFATTVASLPTLNNLVPKRWDQSRNSNSGQSAPKVISGSEKMDSLTTMSEPHVHAVSSNSSQTFADEEAAYRKQSVSTGTGTQPDWNEYHPEIKIPV